MTTGSDPAALPGSERRLHPWSWLFVLIEQLKGFLLPLFLLWFFGRGGDWQEWAAAVAAVALTGSAVYRYFTYRFRIDQRELVIRSGLLERNVRHLPFRRIQNIELRQNLLHRLFGVAELRLESATGGQQSEAVMSVLALDQARAIELRIRAGGDQAEADADRPATESASDRPASSAPAQLSIPLVELIRLGLTRNHGWVVVGALFGLGWQIDNDGIFNSVRQGFSLLYDWLSQLHLGLASSAVLLLGGLLFLLLLRLIGTLVVVLRYYGFELRDQGAQLVIESGLLSRLRQQIPLAKVQRWMIDIPALLHWSARASLQVETAGRAREDESQAGRGVVLPIVAASELDRLLTAWGPGGALRQADWQPIHPKAWRRWALRACFWPTTGWLVALLNLGSEVLPLGVLLVIPAWVAWRSARHARYAFDGQTLIWRRGGWSRKIELIEIDRIQSVELRQSPFDRRAGMADLAIDSAGAGQLRGVMLLRSLVESQARALAEQLSSRMRAGENALLAPEHRRQQNQNREHLEPAEQHAQGAHPHGDAADVGEVIGHRPQSRTQIGNGGGGGTEGAAEVESGGIEAEHQQDEAGHPQGDKTADR